MDYTFIAICAAFIGAGAAVTAFAHSVEKFRKERDRQHRITLRTLGLTEVR
mgnify:FL=1